MEVMKSRSEEVRKHKGAEVSPSLKKRGRGDFWVNSLFQNPPSSPFEKGGLLTAVLFIFLLLVPSAFADDSPGSIFSKGNQLYEKGNYDEAVKEYSRLLEQGVESGNIYFNLGNCYFKKGELGRAILNYERARRLIPDDSDLKSNYNYALSKMESTSTQASTPIMDKIFGIFTLNGLTIFVSSVYVLIVSILTASIFIQSVRRYRIIAISILSLVLISGAFSLYGRVSVLDKEAIVISKNAEAKFEPLDNATTHFTLYGGMKTIILETKSDWIKISRPDGNIGWITKDSIEKI